MTRMELTLDDETVAALDAAASARGLTRDEFARQALKDAVARPDRSAMEHRHREGYAQKPTTPDEFDWESEQAWGDEAA